MSNSRSGSVSVSVLTLALGAFVACSGQNLQTVGDTGGGNGGAMSLGGGSAGKAPVAGATTLPRPGCGDDVKDADETDIDCGGATCAACPDSASCKRHADCASGVCRAGICQRGTCDDATTNGSESDVDCGQDCSKCEAGKTCNSAADCESEVCSDGICRDPTCHDGQKNAEETSVDCGGSCAPCPDGEACHDEHDCASALCAAGRCVSCEDGVHNGGESDVDCGGPDCAACAVGQSCAMDDDCANKLCRSDPNRVKRNVCLPDHCLNLEVDADEVDVDCGGSCDNCGSGRHCLETTDCEVGPCVDFICVEPCTDEQGCFDGGRCTNGECVYCDSAADCPDDLCRAPGVCDCLNGNFVCNAP